MNLEEYKNDNLLIITPSNSKMELLDRNTNFLLNIKYMTKSEFINHYYYSYDLKTISYLISKYNYDIDVAKVYLKNMYVIDIENVYKSDKLNFLKELKKELIANNLLYFDNNFKKFLKDKKVIVYKYNNLEKYEKELFSNYLIIEEKSKSINTSVVRCSDITSEILYVISEIDKLVTNNIRLNNIYLTNIDNEYLYLLKKMFTYFNIPLNVDMKSSIYGTKLVKDFLNTSKFPSINNNVTYKLISVLNSLSLLEDDPNYNMFLIDKLKNTYLDNIKYKDAINIVDLNTYSFNDDDYVFVMGFNNELIPRTVNDEDYISDNIKDEVLLYKTVEKNTLERENTIRVLSNINNLYISYKDKSNFNSYLPSTLISDLGLEVVDFNELDLYKSNIYNKIRLGEYLDKYYKYGEKNKYLSTLVNRYNINYNTYDNSFTGINKENFIKYINNYLKLSYTSLNTYNNCSFKYYINYILKIDPFTDTFSLFIGNLFHYIFSIMYKDDFDLDKEWDKYLEKRKLTLSELYLLSDLKKKLIDAIKIIEMQEEYSNYKNVLCEKEINIKLNKNIDIVFTGKIDKIIYKENISDTYFSLVDYKTGSINTDINNMKYGIDMQLPIYLYLLSNSNLFTNPIYTGIYFQRVIYPSYKWDSKKDLVSLKQDNLKLMGYSTDCQERLEDFDTSYKESKYIKGMKVKSSGDFYSSSKVLSDDDIYNILKYTDKVINETSDSILDCKFDINPKVIDRSKSCDKCNYKDVCFVNNKNYIYLDKVDNLDFLGGDTNEN